MTPPLAETLLSHPVPRTFEDGKLTFHRSPEGSATRQKTGSIERLERFERARDRSASRSSLGKKASLAASLASEEGVRPIRSQSAPSMFFHSDTQPESLYRFPSAPQNKRGAKSSTDLASWMTDGEGEETYTERASADAPSDADATGRATGAKRVKVNDTNRVLDKKLRRVFNFIDTDMDGLIPHMAVLSVISKLKAGGNADESTALVNMLKSKVVNTLGIARKTQKSEPATIPAMLSEGTRSKTSIDFGARSKTSLEFLAESPCQSQSSAGRRFGLGS
eukprot:g24560.t1